MQALNKYADDYLRNAKRGRQNRPTNRYFTDNRLEVGFASSVAYGFRYNTLDDKALDQQCDALVGVRCSRARTDGYRWLRFAKQPP